MTGELESNRETNMGIIVEDARPEDALAIHELRKEVWLTTYPQIYDHISVDDVERNFENIDTFAKNTKIAIESNPNMHFFVARDKEKILGFVLCSIKDRTNERWIDSLYVLDNHQGKGIGKKLAERSLAWLECDKYPVHLEVGDKNTKAKDIYLRWGFEISSHVMPDEDAVLKMPQFEMIRQPASIE